MKVHRRSNNILIVLLFMILVTGISLVVSFFDKGEYIESNIETTTTTEEVVEDNICNREVTIEDLPENITSIIDEINEYYKKNNNYFGFKYMDIETGFNISVNEHNNVFAASTIKAPAVIYLWEQANEGKIDLDERITYEERHYDTGAGIIQYKPVGKTYPTRDLLNYSIIHSDNIAHNMLMKKYGRKNFMEFWKSKGAEVLFTKEDWGDINAHDAVIYMNELYRFYKENNQYSDIVMNDFLNASKKFNISPNGKPVANKAGWYHETKHDASIIFDDKPYILVTLSTLGSKYNGPYFKDISNLVYKLHTEYWNYRNSICKR